MEVITFGETMVLFNPDSTGPLRYVHSFSKSIGGAESNVAIALSRLGHEAGWFSRLGNDEFGRYIKSVIRGEGVDISRVVEDREKSTGLLFKERFAHVDPNIYYYRKNSATSNLSVEDLDYEYIKKAKILHITGITLALSKSARETVYKAIEVAKEGNVLISFDPNIRLKLWRIEEARQVLLDVAKKVDIIFPGISEGELLLGIDDPNEIAKKFLEMGCKIVAVKLGKEGCYVASNNEEQFVKGYVVEKFEDTVGAGDGYAAGFLSGVLKKSSLKECAQLANGVGAMATLVRGDMEGFPTISQVMQFMGKEKHIDR
ncbi:sugar kinase [Marinisporobacter balticus]|uniref:2-dehydro-3-deoxygluconokinase n=1 Tax=Marinisporobacter balticus TaxID=2018667 RepID=A0A4R2LB39_9FIRM|nr:sugar kinase [Marinisporobacter balticus]TCO76495.1 2-dehydro-3-deoxygluconokinase [Marinisporobacter balticus]